MVYQSVGVPFSILLCFIRPKVRSKTLESFPFPISKCHAVVVPVRAEYLTETRPSFVKILRNFKIQALLRTEYFKFGCFVATFVIFCRIRAL